MRRPRAFFPKPPRILRHTGKISLEPTARAARALTGTGGNGDAPHAAVPCASAVRKDRLGPSPGSLICLVAPARGGFSCRAMIGMSRSGESHPATPCLGARSMPLTARNLASPCGHGARTACPPHGRLSGVWRPARALSRGGIAPVAFGSSATSARFVGFKDFAARPLIRHTSLPRTAWLSPASDAVERVCTA